MFVGPSCLDNRIAGLFTLDLIDANEYVMNYTGKIKSEANDFQFLSAKINEFCLRKYEFMLDNDTEVDSVDVGNISRFANNCHDSS